MDHGRNVTTHESAIGKCIRPSLREYSHLRPAAPSPTASFAVRIIPPLTAVARSGDEVLPRAPTRDSAEGIMRTLCWMGIMRILSDIIPVVGGGAYSRLGGRSSRTNRRGSLVLSPGVGDLRLLRLCLRRPRQQQRRRSNIPTWCPPFDLPFRSPFRRAPPAWLVPWRDSARSRKEPPGRTVGAQHRVRLEGSHGKERKGYEGT